MLADQPQDQEVHVILDNYSPHKGNDDWLAKFEGRVQFHFTPTSASWLNQIEIVFSLLQRKTLNGASFKTKDQLREAIEAFIRRHNEHAKPFRWRKREVKGSQLQNTIINLRNLPLGASTVIVHGIARDRDGLDLMQYGTMVAEREAIGHPGLARSEIENVERPAPFARSMGRRLRWK